MNTKGYYENFNLLFSKMVRVLQKIFSLSNELFLWSIFSERGFLQRTKLPDALEHISKLLQQNLGGLYLDTRPLDLGGLYLDTEPDFGGRWEGILWAGPGGAVPKKRTSHSKKRMRSAHKYMKPKLNYTVCPECKNLKLLHTLCGYCLKKILKETTAIRLAELETKTQKMCQDLKKKFPLK